jgi:hypothetical protein
MPPLREYRRSLFAAGLAGAYSFPFAAPLALLARPLAAPALKEAAAGLRRVLGNGKIGFTLPGAAGVCGCAETGAFRFFGPALNIPAGLFFPVPAGWAPPLAPAVLGPGDPELIQTLAKAGTLPAPPELSFRAAALANLTLFPAGCGEEPYSFTWETGRLYWLPRPGRSGAVPLEGGL